MINCKAFQEMHFFTNIFLAQPFPHHAKPCLHNIAITMDSCGSVLAFISDRSSVSGKRLIIQHDYCIGMIHF